MFCCIALSGLELKSADYKELRDLFASASRVLELKASAKLRNLHILGVTSY